MISQNYIYFRIQWFFHEWLVQNSMIFPWFCHSYKFQELFMKFNDFPMILKQIRISMIFQELWEPCWCLLTAALLTRCVLWCTRHWPDEVVMTTWGGGRTGGTRPQHGIHTTTWILPVDIHLQVCGQKARERISTYFVHLIIQRLKSWILIQSRSVQYALSYNLEQHRMAYILLWIPTFVNKSTFGHVTRQEYPRMHVWCKFGILAQISDELLCRQNTVYGRTDRWRDRQTDPDNDNTG